MFLSGSKINNFLCMSSKTGSRSRNLGPTHENIYPSFNLQSILERLKIL